LRALFGLVTSFVTNSLGNCVSSRESTSQTREWPVAIISVCSCGFLRILRPSVLPVLDPRKNRTLRLRVSVTPLASLHPAEEVGCLVRRRQPSQTQSPSGINAICG
jgi:hypothetical protein